MTTGEWLREWYELYVDGSDLAPNTQGMYRRSINALPEWLLRIPLEDLTPMDVYRHVKQRAKKEPRAAQLDRVTLSRAIKIAAKCGLRAPMALDMDTCPTPKHKARETAILTQTEAARYVEYARQSPVAPLLMLCLCGLRRGEALGLQWRDVDLQTGEISIKRQRQRVNGEYVFRPLKTSKSVRRFTAPQQLLEVLRTWPRKLRASYVCDVTPEQLQREHVRVIEAAGLPRVTLHGLRHTMATLAVGAVPMKTLQVALGHSTYQLTADLYADHLSPLSPVQNVVWSGFVS